MRREGKKLIFFSEDKPNYPKNISQMYRENKYAVLKGLDGKSLGTATKWELIITFDVDYSTWGLREGIIHMGSTERLPIMLMHAWRQISVLYVQMQGGEEEVYQDNHNPVINAARILARKSPDTHSFDVKFEQRCY